MVAERTIPSHDMLCLLYFYFRFSLLWFRILCIVAFLFLYPCNSFIKECQLVSLLAILIHFQARRMLAKLDIYRKFTNALAVAVIVSVGWICYEVNLSYKMMWFIVSFFL